MTHLRRSLVVPGLLAVAVVLGACGDDPAARNAAGNDAFDRGEYMSALGSYEALRETHPELPEADYNAGTALLFLEDPGRALNRFDGALRSLDPAVLAVAWYNRASAFFRLDRLDEAREAFAWSLRLDPDNRDAKFNIEVIDRIQEARRPPPPEPEPPAPPEALPDELPPDATSPPDTTPPADAPEGEGAPGEDEPAPEGQPGTPEGAPGESPPTPAPSPVPSPSPGAPGGGEPPPGTQGQAPGDGMRPPSVPDALQDFRSTLSPDEAQRLLDALRDEQRGLRGLLEQPQGTNGPGPAPSGLY